MTPTEQDKELDEILVNLANQIAANEQRLLNGNATREETIDSDSNATMRAEKAIQAHTNAKIAKVLDSLESNKETLFWWNGNEYGKTTAVDMRAIEAERAKLKEVK